MKNSPALCGMIAILIGLLSPPTGFSQIQDSVGAEGKNEPADVEMVQQLLNNISDLSGGPEKPLKTDGIIGPNTIAAIKRYQKMQLGMADGRIDPGQKTELRLLRLNGIHVVLGKADNAEEKKLAEFTTAFANIVVRVDGKKVSVRPPYHINAGKRKAAAEKNRSENPGVQKLIQESITGRGATLGKATPEEIRSFLQAAIDDNLVESSTPDGMRDFLAKYGISTDCSGLASRACNLLSPENPLNVVGRANTAFLATLSAVRSPDRLKAGDLMVKGGSHVRLITDVDVTASGIEFTTLESTASKVLPNGNGIGERRWRFPEGTRFHGLQQAQGSIFLEAAESDQSYIYTCK